MKLCLGILLSAALAASCGETKESHYPDRAAAVADGAIKRGWLPEWLPRSASSIDEWHDLDTNRTVASFSYGEGDAPVLPSECRAPDPRTAKIWAEKKTSNLGSGRVSVVRCPEYSETDRAFVLWVVVEEETRRVYLERTAA
jgi:hypothetical protein